MQQALFGTASCRFDRSDFEACLYSLEEFVIQFPKSFLFYDVRLMQARCFVQLARTNEAVAAYAEVASGKRDYAVTFEMAGILQDPEARLAAYQRIVLLADPEHAGNRSIIHQSILLSLPMCMQLGKYELALAACDQFEDLFPDHADRPEVDKYRKEAERVLAN